MADNFNDRLERKVAEQLRGQRIGYLMGAGSSYLDGAGYPLTIELWDLIKDHVSDLKHRKAIQEKLDTGANGLEQALDLLDDGGADDTPYRHEVTLAIAEVFMPLEPALNQHGEFVHRVAQKGASGVKIFSLNYDPLLERAATLRKIRLVDGFLGAGHSYFEPAVFDEFYGRTRGSFKGRQFENPSKPIQLLKLHGSLGWYECPTNDVRRCEFAAKPPDQTKRLMVPPQRRKADDTMTQPYATLWSHFRESLAIGDKPLHRLACIGYGFGDEHVNSVIERAMPRTDFTLLILTKALPDAPWARWSARANALVVTESRCSMYGETGPGHADLWQFQHLCKVI